MDSENRSMSSLDVPLDLSQGRIKKLSRKEKRKLAVTGNVIIPTSGSRKYRKNAEFRLKSLLRKELSSHTAQDARVHVAAVLAILSRMAYDAARSGTPEQLQAVASLAIAELDTAKSDHSELSIVGATIAADAFRSIASSMFHFSLSGLSDLPALFSKMLYHASRALHLLCEARDASAHQVYIASNLITGLSEIAITGAGTTDLEESGIILHVQNLYRGLRWPAAFPSAAAIAVGELCVHPSKQVLQLLLDELSARSAILSSFWMHSSTSGPLTALWGHSIKQRKVRSVSSSDSEMSLVQPESQPIGIKLAKLHVWQGDSPLGFSDMTAPLVIDVGCGFGVTLLGLAAAHNIYNKSNTKGSSVYETNLPKGLVNFLGCDLSNHCIAYASSIARKWNLSDKCRFCTAPAEAFLEWVQSNYLGTVYWINMQFPTPYKLDVSNLATFIKSDKNKGERSMDTKKIKRRNVQLPGQNQNNGFMITPKLVASCIKIARRNRSVIYFQSNVEDVAVYTRGLFLDCMREIGETVIPIEEKDCMCHIDSSMGQLPYFNVERRPDNVESSDPSLPKRKLIWDALGGERAEGSVWLKTSPSPWYAKTETEAVYISDNKPVYRFAWKV